MWKNNLFNEITDLLLDHRLGKAIDMLENHLLTAKRQTEMDQLLLLKNDYQLMAEYWRKGFQDPEREQLYMQLLRRMYVLTTNIALHDRIRNTSFLMTVYQRPRHARQNWTLTELRRMLEGYVSDVAMLGLEPEHVRRQKGEEIFRAHQSLMNDLFDYIWTSRLWKDSLADAFEDLLLSPTIDVLDQQLMVSAITLSAMNAFGFNKFRVLAHVYLRTTDQYVRQRALVGWVFAADADKQRLYPEMGEIIADMCKDATVRQELTELQMQVLLCMGAEEDTQTIRNEIMPDLMKGNNLRITRQGIIEQEEDPMEDILHPDAAERNMERMEESMRKMIDMQKKGSDIYFAGFSQMKRFPFFSDISNWFVPFYAEHPGIAQTWQQKKGRKFLHTIMRLGAFCDSDKYSFVLAFNQVLDRLPQQMLSMIEQGEAVPMPVGGEVALEEQRQPAFIRRLYLQNLYRFFRLFAYRGEFASPFHDEQSVFFGNPLFGGTMLEEKMPEVASFLLKRSRYDQALRVLDNVSADRYDAQYYLMKGTMMMRQAETGLSMNGMAMEYFRKSLELEPGNRRALMGYARVCFAEKDYTRALGAYQQLQEQRPESKSLQLNAAVCLTSLGRNEEALKLLYKLNYLDADDEQVMRVLAWTLTVDGKHEQAAKFYDRLLSAEKPQPSDMLNYGYCLWFAGDIVSAVGMFRQFLNEQDGNEGSIEQEFLNTEYDLIRSHGITDTEIHLMLDFLRA